MKKLLIITLVILVIGAISMFAYNRRAPELQLTQAEPVVAEMTPTTNTPEQTDYTASFGIVTNGTQRIFTSETYHHQSPDVYIELPDPSIVYVKAPNITWDMFFKTLPFTVEKDCLITGTKQTFCSNESGTLRFFVNEVEDPNTLDRVIQPDDVLEIRYGA